MLNTIIKIVAVSAVAVLSLSSAAFAQGTAYVPFLVNVDATITAVQGASNVQKTVRGGIRDTLILPLGGVSVSYYSGERRLNAPVITGSRGNITLRLPTQSYQNAEIALHAVNGKRVLRGKADAAETISGISRKNVAAGVYMLSVKGADGSAFSARLTHGGGNLNINVSPATENAAPERRLGKSAAEGDWEINVSSEWSEKDSTYTLKNLTAGMKTLQTIILIGKPTPAKTTFTDSRNGKTYSKVVIGKQIWMAENLDYREDEDGNVLGVCYDNLASNCTQYGRLYDWNTAMNGASSSSANPSGVRGVCPIGWHLPSNAEWTRLTNFVGGASRASTKLKSSTGWYDNGNGTDEYGFSALPGGYGNSDGYFGSAGYSGYWWSATGYNAYYAYYRGMGYNYEYVDVDNYYKNYKFSVRCVQD